MALTKQRLRGASLGCRSSSPTPKIVLAALLILAGPSCLRRFGGVKVERQRGRFGKPGDDDTAAAAEAAASAAAASDGNWCDTVARARTGLLPELVVTVPCERMKPAKSAVVTYLTAGLSDGRGQRTVFSGSDYVRGAMALGASLQDHVTRNDAHMLLLVRDGFAMPEGKAEMLEAVGWSPGKAPLVEVDEQYVPRFERYKTFECALLLDADALVVGNIDDLLSCDVLRPNFRVAGTLDYYRKSWYHFNTGSALWNTSAEEMNRVYGLTKDPSFMRRFESDQIFANAAYPDRTNRTLNEEILRGTAGKGAWGRVADLGFAYNAQTHVEYQLPEFWEEQLKDVKILHYTERKGWQCPERRGGPPEPKRTVPEGECREHPGCACDEGYRWYEYLAVAERRAREAAKKGRAA
ncbi:hypothetical protein ACHAWF_012970 [Thalassiosira exigua]